MVQPGFLFLLIASLPASSGRHQTAFLCQCSARFAELVIARIRLCGVRTTTDRPRHFQQLRPGGDRVPPLAGVFDFESGPGSDDFASCVQRSTFDRTPVTQTWFSLARGAVIDDVLDGVSRNLLSATTAIRKSRGDADEGGGQGRHGQNPAVGRFGQTR